MTNRAAIFWLGCIPARTLATYLAARKQQWLRVVAGAIGVTWLSGSVTSRVGAFGGHAFWWDERPLHGALWLGYAVLDEWRLLALDTAFGAANWLGHHNA